MVRNHIIPSIDMVRATTFTKRIALSSRSTAVDIPSERLSSSESTMRKDEKLRLYTADVARSGNGG